MRVTINTADRACTISAQRDGDRSMSKAVALVEGEAETLDYQYTDGLYQVEIHVRRVRL